MDLRSAVVNRAKMYFGVKSASQWLLRRVWMSIDVEICTDVNVAKWT